MLANTKEIVFDHLQKVCLISIQDTFIVLSRAFCVPRMMVGAEDETGIRISLAPAFTEFIFSGRRETRKEAVDKGYEKE